MARPHFTLSDNHSSHNLSLERDVNPIINKYYPSLINAVHAMLSVFATLSLKDRTKPLSLIFEASSGFGKTAVLQMAFPKEDPDPKKYKMMIEKFMYRSDKFTPKSFVSHAANVKKEDLAKIDLLPRIKNKVLITKELAPIFRGRETDLQDNFSILISVLDGKGFTSDSGMIGKKGYVGNYIFNLLGATTPLPVSTHKLMSQLGTRLLFYEVSGSEPTEEELIAYAESGDVGKAEEECRKAVNNFILRYFKLHPVSSIDPKEIIINSDLLKQIVKWARFLIKARSEIKYEKEFDEWTPIAALQPEGPWKVINYFKELAIGHALIHQRKEINESDIGLVAHVAISSVPIQLRTVIKILRDTDSLTSSEGAKLCKCSAPTIRKHFKELEILGLVELQKGSSKTNEADTVTLADEYKWLRG